MHVQSCCFANLNQLRFAVPFDDARRRCLRASIALQCWDNVVTIRNNVATLCCVKNGPCELSRVT